MIGSVSQDLVSTCHDVRRHGAGSGSESVKRSMYYEGLNCVRQNEHLLSVRTVRYGLTAHVLWVIRDSCTLVFLRTKLGALILYSFQ